jgi:hypothetical protein
MKDELLIEECEDGGWIFFHSNCPEVIKKNAGAILVLGSAEFGQVLPYGLGNDEPEELKGFRCIECGKGWRLSNE